MPPIQAGLCAGLITAAVLLAPAGAIGAQLLSARNPAIALPAGGNDNSVAPSITPDGRFVLFSSSASDLVAVHNDQPGLDVFLRDRASNTTALVSMNLSGTGGGNGYSMPGQVSTNGRYVVFQSFAKDLVSDDTNGFSDIFVRDLVAGASLLVSVATDGGAANGSSSEPVMTPDGRYVAFVSDATNLVSGDANGIPDVFVRDRIAGITTLASPGAVPPSPGSGGGMVSPVITPDGRYVAFFTTAAGLAPGVPSTSVAEVYVRDMVAGATTWASTNAADIALSTFGYTKVASYHPRLSDDGRYIAFKTGPTNGPQPVLILRYDVVTSATATVSTNSLPAVADEDDAFGPEMTPDGRYVAFAQGEGTVGNTSYTSVRVWDAQTGTTTLVSDNGSGVPANTFSRKPVIGPQGRFVVFLSDATNLVGNAVASGFHVYRRDLQLASTVLVDVDTNGVGSADCELATLGMGGGRWVAFSSPDGSLVNRDRNHASDVFVRDVLAGTTELISPRDASVVSTTGNSFSSSSQSSVSADGRWVAFASAADDLVANDTNGVQDVFVKDLATGTITLASVASGGSQAMVGWSGQPVISGDGRFVAFLSSATNLVPGQINSNANVFLRDLQTGTTLLVSVSTNGVSPATGDCSDPVISQDGRYAAFGSLARNLAPSILSGLNTYWRDNHLGVTVALKGSPYYVCPPSMSADGRYLAYPGLLSTQLQLKVRDNQLGLDIYSNAVAFTAAVLSPTGSRVLYKVGGTVHVDDVKTGANLLSFASPVAQWNSASWSADGRYLAYVAATNTPNDTNLYLCNLDTGTVQLIGASLAATGSTSGLSDSPAVSADGQFVAYRSYVTDIVPGNTNPAPNICLFNRLAGTNALLTDGQKGTSPVLWNSKPAISGNAWTVAFSSLGSGLASPDLNRVEDAFAVEIQPPLDPADSDADGVPDWWTTLFFGHPTGQAGDLSRAQDDADGDTRSNLEEFLTGTIPTNPASVFTIQIAPVVLPDNTVTVSWAALPGRVYRVQYKDNLGDALWLEVPGYVWVDGSQGYYVAPSNLPCRFYRVAGEN